MTDNNDNTLKYRAGISPGLHPGSLAPHEKALSQQGTPGVAVIAHARNAFTAFHKEMGMMIDANEAAFNARPHNELHALALHQMKNAPIPKSAVMGPDGKLMIPLSPQNARALNRACEISFERAAARADQAMTRIKEVRDSLASAVEAKIVDPNATRNAAMAAETRAHIKAMEPMERMVFLRERLARNDIATVHAVLAASDFLSGLDVASVTQLRKETERHFAPLETAQRDSSDAVIQQLMSATGIFLNGLLQQKVAEPAPEETDALKRLRDGEGEAA